MNLTEKWSRIIGETSCPLVVDPSGVYFRRDGCRGSRTFLCGVSPTQAEDRDYPFVSMKSELEMMKADVDYSVFEERIWPTLANRSTAFEELKLQNAWSGLYDYNTLDRKFHIFSSRLSFKENAIISGYRTIDNVLIATGFSGHGLQQGPAVGRALSELVSFGRFETIDLSSFSLQRVKANAPIREDNVY